MSRTRVAGEKLCLTVAGSTEEIADEGWDELVLGAGPLPAHGLHVSTSWLRRYEVFGNFDPHYVLALEDGQLVGGLSAHRDSGDTRIRIDGALADGPPSQELTECVLPCRVVGGLTDGRTGASFLPGLSLSERALIVDHLFAEAEGLAAVSGEKSVVCRSVDSGDLLLRSVLRSRGYIEIPGPHHLLLAPPAGALEGYIASFSNRYRNMIRREIRKLRDADVSITVEPLTRELVSSALPLIADLNHRYGVESDVDEARAELGMMRKMFKHDAYAVVARHDEQPVGYMDLIMYRNNAWANQAGFDYEFQGTLPLYFGVLFYGLMDFASANDLVSIDYSFATQHAKMSRGCISRPTLRLVRVLDPAGHNRLVTWVNGLSARSPSAAA
jgi:uncharacterized protein